MFNVVPLSPLPGAVLYPDDLQQRGLRISVQVAMVCGLPSCAGGRFDASRLNIQAEVSCNRDEMVSIPLEYTGLAGEFSGILQPFPFYAGRDQKRNTLFFNVNVQDPVSGFSGKGEWTASFHSR